jgi:hypothetical protein
MHVDIFVGTLTRYYSTEWQNSRTRAGHRSPFGPQRSAANDIVIDPVELQGKIAVWLEEANDKLRERLKDPLSWREGMLQPHFSGELGLGGYFGMTLLAGYTLFPHLQRPSVYTSKLEGDPAYDTAAKAEKKDALWEILNCGIWYPGNFSTIIGMKDPSGAPILAGSIDLLWRAVEHLNEVNWGASPETITTWRSRVPNETDTFETQTQFGFATFYEMCRLAREHHLPLKIHY